MTRAQLVLLRPLTPALIAGVVDPVDLALAPHAWPLSALAAAMATLNAAWEWRRLHWANELWAVAGAMRTARAAGLRLHYEPEWDGLAREWDLAGIFARELRHLGDAWFGFRLRGRAHVYLLRFPERVNRAFPGDYWGLAMPTLGIAVVSAQPLGGLPDIWRHEAAHLLIPRLGPESPAFKVEGLTTFLQWCGAGVPGDRASWDTERLRPSPETPLLSAMLDEAFFFDPVRMRECYAAAGNFTCYLVERFGWLAYRQFFRRANARSYAKAFAAAFGVSLVEAEVDWRAEVEAQSGEVAGGTDVD